jgi:hypothetical protein
VVWVASGVGSPSPAGLEQCRASSSSEMRLVQMRLMRLVRLQLPLPGLCLPRRWCPLHTHSPPSPCVNAIPCNAMQCMLAAASHTILVGAAPRPFFEVSSPQTEHRAPARAPSVNQFNAMKYNAMHHLRPRPSRYGAPLTKGFGSHRFATARAVLRLQVRCGCVGYARWTFARARRRVDRRLLRSVTTGSE